MSMMAFSSLIARSKSLLSVAVLARPISRLAVSLLEASQIAQMRFSMYLALSSSGATLSAANSRSRFCVLSPRWARGSVLGGSIGLSGSGSAVFAGGGRTHPAANNAAAPPARNSWLLGSSLAPPRSAIKTRFRQSSCKTASGSRVPRSTLAGLEAALDLVDHVDPTFAADQSIAAMTAAQRFQRVADFHGFGSRARGRAVRRTFARL